MAVPAVAQTDCAPTSDAIVTDRPDVTNSSIVVPPESLQIENGVNLTARDDARLLDGTNTRVRLGAAPCLELLADLPDAVFRLRGGGSGGVSNLTPAIKWQLGPLPGGGGWGTSGMVTIFFMPAQESKHTEEGTFVLEREVGEHADLFVEYVGDFPDQGGPSHAFNSGGAYRLTPRQQIDFHLEFRAQPQCAQLRARDRLFLPLRRAFLGASYQLSATSRCNPQQISHLMPMRMPSLLCVIPCITRCSRTWPT